MIIKVLLVLSIVAVALLLMRDGGSTRRLAFGRLASLAFVSCGVLAVLTPDLVTRLANVVGVGRGADLLLYALVVAVLFAASSYGRRLRGLEDRIADLTREVAIREARLPETRAGTRSVEAGQHVH
jgi:small membrane protein